MVKQVMTARRGIVVSFGRREISDIDQNINQLVAGYGKVSETSAFIADADTVGMLGLSAVRALIHQGSREGVKALYDFSFIDDQKPADAANFGNRMKASGIDAVVVCAHPTQSIIPHIKALIDSEVGAIADLGEVPAESLLGASSAWHRYFAAVVDLGIKDYIIPGDNAPVAGELYERLGESFGIDGITVYAGCPTRGDLKATLQATDGNLHVIVPRGADRSNLYDDYPELPSTYAYAQYALMRY